MSGPDEEDTDPRLVTIDEVELRTKSGRVLTAAEIEALVAEADDGYDVAEILAERDDVTDLGREYLDRVTRARELTDEDTTIIAKMLDRKDDPT